MFLAALDALFTDLVAAGIDLAKIGAVSVSAQQHGHVYLAEEGLAAITALARAGAGGSGPDLAVRFRDAFSYGTAPIWQTADSRSDADEIRSALGGTQRVVELSGSDSPARFTGAVIRRTVRRFPEVWSRTARVSLLSSFLSGVLTGTDCAIDWGNGAGMTLMDYRNRCWSDELIGAVAADRAGGTATLKKVLPPLASPVDSAGPIASYFVERYRFSPECIVNVGSGDNPQSKVMIDGDLLSLGSSFVYMVDTGEPAVDLQGYANSMYDGIGRPFVFACRTNGAMVWDRLRNAYGVDYAGAEDVLAAAVPGGAGRPGSAGGAGGAGIAGGAGSAPVIWQPYAESYPVAPPVQNAEAADGTGRFEELYPGIVDSALVLTRHYARGFETGRGKLALTGGPAASREIVRRVAAVFERPVVVLGRSGAAIGSALSAWTTLCANTGDDPELSRVRADLVPPGMQVEPDTDLVAAYAAAAPRIVDAFEKAAYRKG
jgi:xylulokinase